MIFELGENIYFSTYPPPTLIHLPIALPVRRNPQHRSFFTVVSATTAPPFQPLDHQRNVATKMVFSVPNRWKSLADVQEVPTAVLEFSPRFLGLYGVWQCHDEAVLLLPVGLDVFCELHPETSTEFHSKMQSSHFYHTAENGLTVLLTIPKHGKHNLPR
jgi:hypothetical protein